MSSIKPVRRRLLCAAVSAALSLLGLVALISSGRERSDTFALQASMAESAQRLTLVTSRISEACEAARAKPDVVDTVRLCSVLAELLAEVEEATQQIAGAIARLGLAEAEAELRDELADLADSISGAQPMDSANPERLAQTAERARTLREMATVLSTQAAGTATALRRQATTIHMLGICGVAAGIVMALVVALLSSLDVVERMVDDFDLQTQLDAISGNPVFQRRVQAIAASGPCADAQRKWQLRLQSLGHDRRTHVSFEVDAVKDGERIRLWGKAYKWVGVVKGVQRLVLPAYGRATWRALRRMNTAGIPTATPVYYRKVKSRGLTVGSVLLAEHVGELRSLRRMMNEQFDLLSADQREAILLRLVRWWLQIEDCGIGGVRPRYVHYRKDYAEASEVQFYLCDLDKVTVTRRRASLILRFAQWRSRRALLKWLSEHVCVSEIALCRELFQCQAPDGRHMDERASP